MTYLDLFNTILSFLDDSDCIRCTDCEHFHECWSEQTCMTDEIQQLRDCEYYKERKASANGMDTGTTQAV